MIVYLLDTIVSGVKPAEEENPYRQTV